MDASERRLGELLTSACLRHPDDTAIAGTRRSLTYAQLLEEARAIESGLTHAGIAVDEPVCVLVSNEPGDIAALLAVWRSGAVAVPLHRTTPPELAASIRERTGARFVIDSLADQPVGCAGPPPAPRPLLADAALIVFTSGSTGPPKGVVVGHRQLADKIDAIDSLLAFRPDDRTLLVLNLTFSFGMWVCLLTLLRGGTLVVRDRFERDGFLGVLAEQRISRVALVPTMMRLLLAGERATPGAATTPHLRSVLIGGEQLGVTLAAEIRALFESATLVDIYGLTETTTCDFFAFPAQAAAHPGCIGAPSPGVTFRIAHADQDGVGELQLRSPYLMHGYLDAPETTAAAYDDGWFRTGDLAVALPDGLVELRGRLKDVINRGGNKVTPAEVELALGRHPDVAAALVAGVPDPVIGERIHALVVPRGARTIDETALRAHLTRYLERFKHPDVIEVVAELPLGRTGKSDRGALRATARSPRTTTERRDT
ncbi:class I adenylate-forming enzyme family protein [Cumulibacter manganitolerans]|uniref:class I adenylate-forming enzyme family protein n=1 Tax=Cumulibacter manganitolerans TaxID=1884992 RepID=UPI001296054A|nr:class I adenylate-forming enzyme family protein [Cumulibacter manganitolerans]